MNKDKIIVEYVFINDCEKLRKNEETLKRVFVAELFKFYGTSYNVPSGVKSDTIDTSKENRNKR